MIERISTRLTINRRPKEKPFYHKADLPHRIALEVLSHVYTPIINVEGIENIQNVEDLLSENKKIIVLSNHLTNADAEVIYQVFKRAGYRHLAEIFFFLEGEKLRRTPIASLLTRSQNAIFVWPKSLPPQNEEEAIRQRTMNIKSIRDAKQALKKGHMLVTFPEGGRSYEGKLKQGEPEIAHYLKLVPNTVVLPVAVWGIEKIIPPRKKLVLPNPFQKVNFAAGTPIEVDSLFEQYKDCPKDEINSRIVTHIMEKGLAPLLPPQYRGVYA